MTNGCELKILVFLARLLIPFSMYWFGGVATLIAKLLPNFIHIKKGGAR
tara:strand:- start:125 stop:271 length:147 start_codon:yes stop_codon:yes gene_type:complete